MDARLYQIFTPRTLRSIRRAILVWYDRHKRDLPWRRRADDPYAQWVAEIMLQQTRVDTVIGYYDRFLERFPDVHSLAAGRHQTVLKLWEGLGYYRRALHLHRAAKVLAKRGGTFPRTSGELRALPGIGDYTAAAIASIACGEPAPAVDGNVSRVVARVFGIRGDPHSAAWKGRVRKAAAAVISPTRPGDFNQALMDLGTSVCTPASPRCPECPLKKSCQAFHEVATAAIPGTTGNRPAKAVRIVAVAAVSNGKLLIRRRPAGGLWSGLWELPCFGLSKRDPLSGQDDALGLFRARCRGRPAAIVTHALTHRRLEFRAYILHDLEPSTIAAAAVDGHRWVDRRQLEALPISTAHRRILSAISHKLPGLATVRA